MAQDFLLESYDQPYPRRCLFSVWGEERLQQFNIKEGDDLAVDIDLDAREYQGRYYNSVRAWRVVRITPPQPQAAVASEPPIGVGAPPPPPAADGSITVPTPLDALAAGNPLGGDATEDLPF